MKRVLLLGDSIRMGYDSMVKELLEGQAEVLFDQEDNGRFAAYSLWQANQMFRIHGRFDVVHFNNGYWDMNIEAPMTQPIHPLPEYLHFLRRILEEIRQNGATPVFATTTPILEPERIPPTLQATASLHYDNAWVKTYNQGALALMEQEKVAVNDLYNLCLSHPLYHKCDDLLHLTQEGYACCAQQVVDVVKNLL